MKTLAQPSSLAVLTTLPQPLHLILLGHNVEATLETYLRRVDSYAQSLAPEHYSITLIDRASTDRTLARAEAISRELPSVEVLYAADHELASVLHQLKEQDEAIVVVLEVADQPDPLMIQDLAHVVSAHAWHSAVGIGDSAAEPHSVWEKLRQCLGLDEHRPQLFAATAEVFNGLMAKISEASLEQLGTVGALSAEAFLQRKTCFKLAGTAWVK